MSVILPMQFPSHSGAALIASPNVQLREQVLQKINGRCCPVQQVAGGADALAKLEKGNWQVLFLDRRLPDLDAEELKGIIGKRYPGVPVVMVDCDAASPLAEEESFPSQYAPGVIPARQPKQTAAAEPLPGMIGKSAAMGSVYRLARLVAPRTTTVLITGQTGTGKELVARGVHCVSPRSQRPLIVVNCAAIPETLLESELFGYTRGAFTGAVQAQMGRIAAAHMGTLFLDEISELPLSMQAKLLRFLEHKELQRLGAAEPTRVDVRVVAASNVDLEARIHRGEFRQDLFYRLSAFPIELPPLIQRREDIIPLAEHFLTSMVSSSGSANLRLGVGAIHALEAHSWKGNVRELQHVMERASIMAGDCESLEPEHLCLPACDRE